MNTDIPPPPAEAPHPESHINNNSTSANDLKWSICGHLDLKTRATDVSKWALTRLVGVNSATSFITGADGSLYIFTDNGKYRKLDPKLGAFTKDISQQSPVTWLCTGNPSDKVYGVGASSVLELDMKTGKAVRTVASGGGFSCVNDPQNDRLFYVQSDFPEKGGDVNSVWMMDAASGHATKIYSYNITRYICSIMYNPKDGQLYGVESYAPTASTYALNNCLNNSAHVDSINLVTFDLSGGNTTTQKLEFPQYSYPWFAHMDADNNMMYVNGIASTSGGGGAVMDMTTLKIVQRYPELGTSALILN